MGINKVLVGALLVVSVAFANITHVSATTTLTDINNHWGKEYIQTLVDKGGIKGYPDGTFKPNNTISFAEFLSLIVNSTLPKDEIGVANQGENWATPIYNIATEYKFIYASEFSSDPTTWGKPISRENMALILIRAASYKGEDISAKSDIQKYILDYSNITPRNQVAVEKAYSAGLLTGNNFYQFLPKASLTRAEAATTICRLLNYTARAELKPVPNIHPQIIMEGSFAGRLRPDYATSLDLQALKSAKFTKENGKYYLSITFPDLPQGFKWIGYVGVYDKNDSYLSSLSIENVTGYQKFELKPDSGSNISTFRAYTLDISAVDSKNQDMISHKIVNVSPGNVLSKDSNYGDQEWVKFDTTGIFGW